MRVIETVKTHYVSILMMFDIAKRNKN